MLDERDDSSVYQWIVRRLGAPKVCVELTLEHIQDSLRQAKLWYMGNKGEVRKVQLPLAAGQSVYDLPADVDVVIDVVFTLKPADISTLFSPVSVFDERIPYDLYANSAQLGNYSSYVQLTQYIELTRRVGNAENDWRQEGKKLMVWPTPSGGAYIQVYYTAQEVDFSKLGPRDFQYIRDYALALAKRDLGRIRSKTEEWQGAQTTVRLDGDKLLAEAKEEMEALTAALLASGSPMPFITG